MARLINALGTELCKIFAEPSLPAEGKAQAWTMIEQITPYLLKFLANEYDDTSSAVFPFVNDMLYLVRECFGTSNRQMADSYFTMISSSDKRNRCNPFLKVNMNSWVLC